MLGIDVDHVSLTRNQHSLAKTARDNDANKLAGTDLAHPWTIRLCPPDALTTFLDGDFS
jgi:hypothetical protein